ncbi:hypothetical protein ACLB2K_041153 [Fragaria x ananassa]
MSQESLAMVAGGGSSREGTVGFLEAALVKARVLPSPLLKYHDSGREKSVYPQTGQWNMTNKKMFNGGKLQFWAFVNFSRLSQEITFPFLEALVNVCNRKIKRTCETELGIVSQCCVPKKVKTFNRQYLENLALKINVKKLHVVTDGVPKIIFGADVTHPTAGNDSSPSVAARFLGCVICDKMQSDGSDSVSLSPTTQRAQQSLSASDTRGKHRIQAELKRFEQEARFLEMIEILVLRILSFSGLMVSFEFDGWSIYNRIGLETNNESKRIACWMEELEQLEKIDKASAACKEILSNVETRPDPLLPITHGPLNPFWDRWFEGPKDSKGCRCWIL